MGLNFGGLGGGARHGDGVDDGRCRLRVDMGATGVEEGYGAHLQRDSRGYGVPTAWW
jgi:hypothetical protein